MKARVLIIAALLLLCTGVASAQVEDQFAGGTNLGTPDGMTPAEETVCDGETGAAFGLCNAYCEAMDCDSASPQASQNACDRVAAKFQQITGGAPPCECPCVGRIDGYIEALNGDFGLTACTGFSIPGVTDFVALVTEDPFLLPGAQTVIPEDFGFCGFASGTGAFLVITLEEAVSCNALVRKKGADAGLTCPPAPCPSSPW